MRDIVRPNMRTLLRDCPQNIRPRWNTQDSCYYFPNGSEIHVAGSNNGHEDDSRGNKSDLNVVDEAGYVDRLSYLLKSVLLPQTLTTGGRTIVISTPPESPAHELIPILRSAESSRHYFRHTIDQTTHLSQRAKDQLIKSMGGPLSTQVRRELYCEIVTDESRAVIPEFTEARAIELVRPVPPPTYETPLVAMDVGFEDYSHVLFGYYDFKRAKLCIQRETRIRRMRTDELAAEVKRVEGELWTGPKAPRRPVSTKPFRVSDVDLILLADMSALHGLHFMPTSKDTLEAMVNQVRIWVQTGRIEIDPCVTHLIRQLKCAIWNKQRTAFDRSAEDGHFDAVAALVYMVRNCPVHANPYPAFDPSVIPATHQIRPALERSEQTKAVASIFGRH